MTIKFPTTKNHIKFLTDPIQHSYSVLIPHDFFSTVFEKVSLLGQFRMNRNHIIILRYNSRYNPLCDKNFQNVQR